MNIILPDNRVINIFFNYLTDTGCTELRNGSGSLSWAKQRNFTVCTIVLSDDVKVNILPGNAKYPKSTARYEGVAICKPKESFSKSVGRRLALYRAISAIPKIKKGVKDLIWQAYYAEHADARKTKIDIVAVVGEEGKLIPKPRTVIAINAIKKKSVIDSTCEIKEKKKSNKNLVEERTLSNV